MIKKTPRRALRLPLLVGLFFCGALLAHPQSQGNGEVKRISLNEAVDLAVKNNLNLETARINLDIKKRKSDLVWNEFLPSLSATGTLARDNYATTSSIVSGAGTVQQYNEGYIYSSIYMGSITLPQWHLVGNFAAELTFSFALVEGIKSYKLDYQAGLISFEKATLQIEQGIRKMYNSILLLEANAALLNESYNNAVRQANMAEANYRAGLAPRLTWLQAQVAVENIKPSLNDLDHSLKNLKGNFAILLGLSYDIPLELEPIIFGESYIPPDVDELISRAASGRPDIQELQAAIMTLNSQRKALTLSSYTPFLRFAWSLSSTFSPYLDPFKENLFSTNNWYGGGNFSLTLGWSINSLFSFTKEGQQRKDMEAAIQMQNLQLVQMIRETELEVFTKVNSLEKTRTTAAAQQAAVNLADESYRLTEEAYRAGLQDFLSVQSAALALEQAKLQLLTQQFNYLNDLIDLEYSVGVPFGTLSSLGTINDNGGEL